MQTKPNRCSDISLDSQQASNSRNIFVKIYLYVLYVCNGVCMYKYCCLSIVIKTNINSILIIENHWHQIV